MDESRIDIGHQAQTATDFGVSYFLAIPFPPAIADVLYDTSMTIAREIGDGFYAQPPQSLHISVLDFVDGIIDPAKFGYASKADVWAGIQQKCDAAIVRTVGHIKQFDIRFGELIVTDTALIIKGEDDGQVQRIREGIMHEIGGLRLPRTKKPPSIIHSSLGRLTKVLPLEPVRRAAAEENVIFTMHVDHLTLYNQLKMNMLESQELKVYDL